MKRFTGIIAMAVAATVAFAGCGKKSAVDTGKLESSFKSSDAATQSDVDKAVTAIKAGNYSAALTDLQKIAAKAKLTPEQQRAIKDAIAQVQKEISAMAGQATKDAEKAAGDLKKSLPIK